jgi:hypothetical protein
MTNSEILAQLEALRQEYPAATPERQEVIEKDAAKLMGQLHKCYECGADLPDDHETWFCSTEHKDAYAKAHPAPTKGPKTMEQMRKGMEELKALAALKKHGYKVQKLNEV